MKAKLPIAKQLGCFELGHFADITKIIYACPMCGFSFRFIGAQNYCCDCGQKLNWKKVITDVSVPQGRACMISVDENGKVDESGKKILDWIDKQNSAANREVQGND